MKDNKLIAEFMGYEVHPTYEDERYDLHYHTSWDWLMPVIEKCMRTGDDTDKWDDIFNTLSTLSINKVYKAVVQFIKELKQD